MAEDKKISGQFPILPLIAVGALLASTALLSTCTLERYPTEDTGLGSYVAAQNASNIGEPGRALGFFIDALEKDPGNEVILEKAFNLALKEGEFTHALRFAEELATGGSEVSNAQMLLALDNLVAGDYEAMQRALEGATGPGYDSLVTPLARAWARAAAGEVEEAFAALRALSAVAAFRPLQQTHAAYILDYAGRAPEAEVAYERILADNQIVSAHPVVAYGVMLQKQGREDKAAEIYERYLDIFPNSEALKEAAHMLQQGIVTTSRAASPEAALAGIMIMLSGQLAGDGALQASVAFGRFGMFLDPGQSDGLLLLGNIFIALEEPAAALRVLRTIAMDDPRYVSGLIRQSFALDDMERIDEAFDLMRDYLAGHGENGSVRAALGDLHRIQSQFEDAARDYTLAIEAPVDSKATDWFVYFTRAISYDELDLWNLAEADFLKALELEKDQPDVLNYLGYSWIDRGMHIEEARYLIERAAEQRPNDGAITDSLGWVQYLRGDYENAVINLERAVELEPGDPVINDHLGDVYWVVGREMEARFQWSHALSLDPDDELLAALKEKLVSGLIVISANKD